MAVQNRGYGKDEKTASDVPRDTNESTAATSCTEPLQVVSYSVGHVTLRCMNGKVSMMKCRRGKQRTAFLRLTYQGLNEMILVPKKVAHFICDRL